MTMSPTARRNATWIAVAVVVVAMIAIFTIPDNSSMSDLTTGTPPAAPVVIPPGDVNVPSLAVPPRLD